MVKTIVIIVAVLLAARYFIYRSGLAEAPGLQAGQLQVCPDTPNCVCSEAGNDADHYIAAIALDGTDTQAAFKQLKAAVEANGGQISQGDERYFAARFSSKLLGYVDDFEARLDEPEGQIHLRSASRLGRSDFGVNKKRVESVKQSYAALNK